MEIQPIIDPTQITLLVAGSVSITQIIRDVWVMLGGTSGEWLKVVCVAVSCVLGAILIFAPNLWVITVVPLLGAIGTGGVSFVKEMSSQGKPPFRD